MDKTRRPRIPRIFMDKTIVLSRTSIMAYQRGEFPTARLGCVGKPSELGDTP